MTDTYQPSTRFLCVQVTKPTFSKTGVFKGLETAIEGLVLAYVGTRSWVSKKTKVEIMPVYIGWTRDAFLNLVNDDDLASRHKLLTMDEVLNKYPDTSAPDLTGVAEPTDALHKEAE